jgi:tripartite-type tricarboxylate transporter receptor subunit TctC
MPANSVTDFVQYVKAHPGEINYGSPGFATPHHLAMELFKHATGTDLVHIPYKGTSGVMSDLVGNHVSAMFVPTHVALPLAADKQIRILGVASAERVAAAPEVPTLAEQGVTGFEVRPNAPILSRFGENIRHSSDLANNDRSAAFGVTKS